MNMLNALQSTPAAAVKRPPEPKDRDEAVADIGFAKLLQQQSQLRQASQRQLEQHQAAQRRSVAAPQAGRANDAPACERDLAEASDAGRHSDIEEVDAESTAAPATTAQPPWLQARNTLASAAETASAGDQDPSRLTRTGQPALATDAAATAGLTASAAWPGQGPGASPTSAAPGAAAPGADSGQATAVGLGTAARAPLAAANLAQSLLRQALHTGYGAGDARLDGVDEANSDSDSGSDSDVSPYGVSMPAGHAPGAGHRADATLALLRAQAEPLALSVGTGGRDAARQDQADHLSPAPSLQPTASDSAPQGTDSNALAVAGALASAAVGAVAAGTLAGADAAAAPAQAQVQAHIPVPLDSALFAPALGTQISLLAGDGVQTALLQLNPAEMGPISVQIVLDGQAARVEFQADLAHTRSVIEASLPALASALQDAGLTLAGGGVFQQSPGRQDSGNGQPQAAARGSEQRHGLEPATSAAAPLRAGPRRGLVDLVA